MFQKEGRGKTRENARVHKEGGKGTGKNIWRPCRRFFPSPSRACTLCTRAPPYYPFKRLPSRLLKNTANQRVKKPCHILCATQAVNNGSFLNQSIESGKDTVKKIGYNSKSDFRLVYPWCNGLCVYILGMRYIRYPMFSRGIPWIYIPLVTWLSRIPDQSLSDHYISLKAHIKKRNEVCQVTCRKFQDTTQECVACIFHYA